MTKLNHTRPDNSQKVAVKGGLATFYIYEDRRGRPCAQAHIGKRAVRHYHFRSELGRASYIERTTNSLIANAKEKAERRVARNRPHNLEAGLIFYTSWGYDQTNTEFYQIVNVPSACYVELQEIAAPLVNGEDCHMSGQRFPDPDQKIGEVIRRKVDMSGSRPSIRINNVVTAWIWDGKEKRVSWYH